MLAWQSFLAESLQGLTVITSQVEAELQPPWGGGGRMSPKQARSIESGTYNALDSRNVLEGTIQLHFNLTAASS